MALKKIKINGPIIDSDEKLLYDWWGLEATCARDVAEALKDSSEDIEVSINSFGGYVYQGAEIYTMLKEYPGKVTVNVISAYSAASIIAMAGDVVRISPVGTMMIHNAAGGTYGDYRDMSKSSEQLKMTNETMSNAYSLKTGMSKEELLEHMNNEKWLGPEEAIELGFADEMMFVENPSEKLVASGYSSMLSKEMIEKTKVMINTHKDIDIDAIANKVIEKMNTKIKEPTKPENTGFARFLF